MFNAGGVVRVISQESTRNSLVSALISQDSCHCVLVIIHSVRSLLVFVALKLKFTTDASAFAASEWSGFASVHL